MLLHLAKFASMFGLKSSAGSYEKMQNECSLDAENPFCAQVGVSERRRQGAAEAAGFLTSNI